MGARKLEESNTDPRSSVLFWAMDQSIAQTAFRNIPLKELAAFQFSTQKTRNLKRNSGHPTDVVVVYDSGATDWDETLQSIRELRKQNYSGIIILITEDASTERLIQAYKAGIDDYLVNTLHLDLLSELLKRRGIYQCMRQRDWNPEAIEESGFFRSLGIPAKQIYVLKEYARDFPRHEELAKRLDISPAYIRKTFSEVYRRLAEPLAVETQAQLAQLLTVFAVYG